MFTNKISKLFSSNLHSLSLASNSNSNVWSKNFGSFNFAKNFEEGLKSAKTESKPLILIVHKAFCGACKILIPKLTTCKEMEILSDNFVLVNAYNGQEPKAKLYAPDGAYVPRIVFLRSDGTILKQVTNSSITGNEYKYYYQTSEDVVKSMKLALELHDVEDIFTGAEKTQGLDKKPYLLPYNPNNALILPDVSVGINSFEVKHY